MVQNCYKLKFFTVFYQCFVSCRCVRVDYRKMLAIVVDMMMTCAIPLFLGVFLFAVCCVDNPLGVRVMSAVFPISKLFIYVAEKAIRQISMMEVFRKLASCQICCFKLSKLIHLWFTILDCSQILRRHQMWREGFISICSNFIKNSKLIQRVENLNQSWNSVWEFRDQICHHECRH